MAIKKYLMAIGDLASPCVGIPLVKVANLSSVLRFGPTKLETKIINATKPPAKRICKAIGK